MECATCQPGFFGDVSGMTTCIQCSSGTHTSITQQTTYTNLPGMFKACEIVECASWFLQRRCWADDVHSRVLWLHIFKGRGLWTHMVFRSRERDRKTQKVAERQLDDSCGEQNWNVFSLTTFIRFLLWCICRETPVNLTGRERASRFSPKQVVVQSEC